MRWENFLLALVLWVVGFVLVDVLLVPLADWALTEGKSHLP